MRPEYLIMSGFGPYAGKTEIDFGKLGESGLYLITGDTGAGKTTIFDAISYALYGEASGQVRDPGMFRSKYAAPETPTYVELRFAYQGRSYTVRRNPEYIRPKGRGTGTTVQKAEAELLFPDGRPPVTKAREVTRAVTELTGLDYRQFTQIAMIAQGDFQKLLLAGTAERGEIFRQIFHTGLYQEIQKRLKDAARDKWQQYDELRRSISQFLDGVDAGQDPALCQEFEELKKEHFDGRAVRGMEILERLLELDGKQVSELEGQLLELDKAIETENGRLNGVQQRRELERSLAEKQEELARLSGSISDAAGREEDCRKQAERCPELEEGIRAAGRQLEQLLELERQ
ncbi:MAG: SMC family ATPase, partial [Eubacteriales bacterium]|nr:SMC family ATPase [Eubacteriales bacterium]